MWWYLLFNSRHRGHKQRPTHQIPLPPEFINELSLKHNHVAASGPQQQQSYEAMSSITAHKALSGYCHSVCVLPDVGVHGES